MVAATSSALPPGYQIYSILEKCINAVYGAHPRHYEKENNFKYSDDAGTPT